MFTLKSKTHGPIKFIRPEKDYVYVRFPGKQWQQICKGGKLTGSCSSCPDLPGETDKEWQVRFEKFCRAWWRQYLDRRNLL